MTHYMSKINSKLSKNSSSAHSLVPYQTACVQPSNTSFDLTYSSLIDLLIKLSIYYSKMPILICQNIHFGNPEGLILREQAIVVLIVAER